MRRFRVRGIKSTILQIVYNHTEKLGEPYVDTEVIRQEIRKTPIYDKILEKYPDGVYMTSKVDVLSALVWQTTKDLRRENKLEYYRDPFTLLPQRGKFVISESYKRRLTVKRYKPSLCSMLQKEIEIHCHKCRRYYYKVVTRGVRKVVCPVCGSDKVTIRFFRWYCPVNHMYIGNPQEQCELLWCIDYTRKTKFVKPMRSCYVPSK